MRTRFMRTVVGGLGVLAAVCALAGDAVATGAQVPEFGGGMIPAAIGVVTAGVLMLRARRRSK